MEALGAMLDPSKLAQMMELIGTGKKIYEIISKVTTPEEMELLKETFKTIAARTHIENTTYKGKKCVAIMIEKVQK